MLTTGTNMDRLIITISRQPYSGSELCSRLRLFVCSHFCKQDISKANRQDIYKIYNRHSLHTTLEVINFWCKSYSRWL